LAYVAAHRASGWTLLRALWPVAQPEVRRWAADRTAALSPPARDALARLTVPDTDGTAPLTPREWEVLALIGEGLTNVEVADRLVISRRTVESHVAHIKTKLGLHRRSHLMAWSLERARPDRVSTSD
jgi:DNA-binding NarL/FixJ family response regulator